MNIVAHYCARIGSSGIVLDEHIFELFTILDDYLFRTLCSVDTPWASDSFGYCFYDCWITTYSSVHQRRSSSFRSTNSNRHVLPGGVASGVRLLGLNRTISRRGWRAGREKQHCGERLHLCDADWSSNQLLPTGSLQAVSKCQHYGVSWSDTQHCYDYDYQRECTHTQSTSQQAWFSPRQLASRN